jgi:uncharacterized membrane protein YphA (DoxX/SURF4 family)/peroxiredoxin
MTTVVALARLALAAVFVVSAIAKLRDRPGSRSGVEAFGVPQPLVGFVAGALPVTELACALLLLLPDPAATVGAVGSLVLLLTFTTAIVANLARGRHPECHCFGSLSDKDGIGWDTVARNVALMALAGFSLIGAGGLRSVPWVLADLSAPEGGILVGVVLLLALLVTMGLALRTLVQRYGAVLLRLEALEQATGAAPLREAPDFRLPDLDGVELSLDEALDAGRPALVVFVSPTCHNCTQLLPDLAAWQSDPDHPFSVVVVSDGSVEDNRAKIADVGPLRVLLQDEFDTAHAYGIAGTPGAVMVGVDGLLAGSPMHGVDGVRSLHDSIAQVMATDPVSPEAQPHVHHIEQRPVSPGDLAPTADLRSEDDHQVSVAEAVGEDAVLLFWRYDCGFCQEILNDVLVLERSVPVRLVTRSTVSTIRDSGLVSPIVRDPDGALETWLRVPGTPAAARLRGGTLDSVVAVGGPDVLELLRVTRMRPAGIPE